MKVLESVTESSANFPIKGHYSASVAVEDSAMKNESARPYEIGPPTYQLVTDSMILSETYVDSAIRRRRESPSDSFRSAKGIVNGVFIGLLLWLLVLLLFIAF